MTNVMDSAKWHGSQTKENTLTKETLKTMKSMVMGDTPGQTLQFGTMEIGKTEWGAVTGRLLIRMAVGMKALLKII